MTFISWHGYSYTMNSQADLLWTLLPWICPPSNVFQHSPSRVDLTPEADGVDPRLDPARDPSLDPSLGPSLGMARLTRTPFKQPFEALNSNYVHQLKHLSGPTSAVIVLNSLTQPLSNLESEFTLDFNPDHSSAYHPSPYHLDGFFTPATDQIKTREEIVGYRSNRPTPCPGLSLKQLYGMLQTFCSEPTHPIQQLRCVQAHSHRSDTDLREDLKQKLLLSKTYVIANFWRPALLQSGGGHFSPLAAYDELSDSFLIMDVDARMGYYWLPSDELIHAMRTFSGVTRGYLIVGSD